VGLWKKIQEARERNRVEGQAKLETARRDFHKAKDELVETWRCPISPSLQEEDTEEPPAPQSPDSQKEELKRLITDPAALDSLTDEQLERLRLTTENTLERCEREFTSEEKQMLRALNTPEAQADLATPIIGGIMKSRMKPVEAKAKEKQEQIDDLKLLLKFIAAKQKGNQERTTRPQPPQPALTKAEQRERLLTEIQTLQAEKAAALDKMRGNRAGDEEIRRYENMYDNAIHRLETKLENLLIR
jgi:hypothetical protein